ILRKTGQHEKAIEIFWQAYENLKERKQLYTYMCLLLQMGNTYAALGEMDLARMYLNLVKRSVDPANHKRVARILERRLQEIGNEAARQYDLVCGLANNLLVEKKRGEVDFHNRFVLLELLRLFLK